VYGYAFRNWLEELHKAGTHQELCDMFDVLDIRFDVSSVLFVCDKDYDRTRLLKIAATYKAPIEFTLALGMEDIYAWVGNPLMLDVTQLEENGSEN
jgi:hypothetical protein